ncbi:MAG: hypothetical protein WDN27_00185 [Candidatus Saccharibacteria bacterium]
MIHIPTAPAVSHKDKSGGTSTSTSSGDNGRHRPETVSKGKGSK